MFGSFQLGQCRQPHTGAWKGVWQEGMRASIAIRLHLAVWWARTQTSVEPTCLQTGKDTQRCSSLLGISTIFHGLCGISIIVKAFLAPDPQHLACRPQWAVGEASRRQAVPHSTATGRHAGGRRSYLVPFCSLFYCLMLETCNSSLTGLVG